jgi:hypothetical protein
MPVWTEAVMHNFHVHIEVVSQLPGARTGTIEVRPIWERGVT